MTRAEKREAERQRKMPDSSPALLILYLIGILGIMITVNTALHISNALFIPAVLAVCIISTVLWYIYTRKPKYFINLILICCGLSVLFVSVNFDNISQSFYGMYTAQNSNLSGSVVIVFAAMLILLLFTLEFVSRNHSIMFLLCAALMVFGPTIGITATPLTSVMIIIYQFGFMVLNMTTPPKRKNLVIKKRSRINAASTIAMVLILLICFIPSFVAEKILEPDMLMQVYTIDGYIQDIVSYFSDYVDNGVIDGTVSRGNLHQTGEKMFTAEIVNPPEDRLYLKGFTGSYYYGDTWIDAYNIFDDDKKITSGDYLISPYSDYFSDFMKPLSSYDDNTNDYSNYDGSYNSTYFYREPFINDLIRETVGDYFSDLDEFLKEQGIDMTVAAVSYDSTSGLYIVGEDDNILTVDTKGNAKWNTFVYKETAYPGLYNLEDVSKEYTFDLSKMPNYPSRILSTSSSDPVGEVYSDGVDYDIAKKGKGNKINISPEDNMPLNVLIPYLSENSSISAFEVPYAYTNNYRYMETMDEMYAKDGWEGKSTYENFIDKYIEAIQDEYTYTPYENMPRLTDLCSETQLTDVNEITTFILYTLQTHASYSTTPGTVPFNKDTIEYFLFENHKGYCVHFATSAAMMYRLFGIPARYVSGYVIDSNQFQPIDGVSESEKSSSKYSYRAEVTDHCAHAWVEIFLKDYGWVPVEVTPTSSGTMIAEYPGYDTAEMNRIMKKYDWHFSESGGSGAAGGAYAGNNSDGLSFIQTVIIVILCCIALSAAGLLARRAYILKKQDNMNSRQLFDRLIRALHFSGLLTSLNGSETHFAEVLSQAVPDLTEAESARLIEIMQTDNYSPENIQYSDTKFVRTIYERSVKYLYDKVKWYKKPVFRYIMSFN